MKSSTRNDLFFFLQYPIIAIMWYWLFRDNTVVRFVAGTLTVGSSLLILIRPQWSPNRPGISGRMFPDRVFNLFRKTNCWTGILFGALILSGFRITTYRTMGIIAVLFMALYSVFYIYWIKTSDSNERAETKGFWIFAMVTIFIFSALGALFILMGDREIKMFREMSPYPMMVFYPLMGVWHYRVIRKKERQLAKQEA